MNGIVGGKLVRPPYLAEFAFGPRRLPTPAIAGSMGCTSRKVALRSKG